MRRVKDILKCFAFIAIILVAGCSNSQDSGFSTEKEINVDSGSEINYATVTDTVLSPIADSYTRNGSYTDTNYGTSPLLYAKGSSTTGEERKAYFKFDLSSLSNVDTAKLRVYGSATGSYNLQCNSHTTDTWTESGITYTNNPKTGPLLKTVTVGTTAQYYEWDVTAFVKQEFAGNKIATLYLCDPAKNEKLFTLNSKESVDNKPQLVITGTAIDIPLPPTGISSENVTSSSVTLTWSASLGATSYTIYRSSTEAGTYNSVGTSTATSFTNTGLSPSTPYWYKVSASNSAGESGQSTFLSVSTIEGGTTPDVPTNLAKVSATSTSISLSWTASNRAEAYAIYRSSTATGTYTSVGTSTTTTFTNTGLSASTTYYYKVSAKNSAGESALSASLSAATSGAVTAATSRYRLSWRSDPSTTMVVGWHQITSTSAVYYGTQDFGTSYTSYPYIKTVDASNTALGMSTKFARLSGLTPNTVYYFVVKSDNGYVSDRMSFKTAPNDNTPFTYVSASDVKMSGSTQVTNFNEGAVILTKLRPLFILYAGDFTANCASSEWQDFLNKYQKTISPVDGRIVPIIAARGNHETSDSVIVNMFDFPTSNVVAKFTIGQLGVYVLNTENSTVPAQGTWLQGQLAQDMNRWKIVVHHRPINPHSQDKTSGADATFKTNGFKYWTPHIDAYGVNFVHNGHSHATAVSWPIKAKAGSTSAEFVRNDSGTVYFGEGGWGVSTRPADKTYAWDRNSGQVFQYGWLWVTDAKIDLRFVLHKNSTNVAQLSDSQMTVPSGLSLWTPSNGSVITVTKPVTLSFNNISGKDILAGKYSVNDIYYTAAFYRQFGLN